MKIFTEYLTENPGRSLTLMHRRESRIYASCTVVTEQPTFSREEMILSTCF